MLKYFVRAPYVLVSEPGNHLYHQNVSLHQYSDCSVLRHAIVDCVSFLCHPRRLGLLRHPQPLTWLQPGEQNGGRDDLIPTCLFVSKKQWLFHCSENYLREGRSPPRVALNIRHVRKHQDAEYVPNTGSGEDTQRQGDEKIISPAAQESVWGCFR